MMAGFIDRFKKREETEGASESTRTPVNDILAMRGQGLTNNQIITELRAGGYKITEIRNALMQADIKSGVIGTKDRGGLPPDYGNEEENNIKEPKMPAVKQFPKSDEIKTPMEEMTEISSIGGESAAKHAFSKEKMEVSEIKGPEGAKPEGYVFETPESGKMPEKRGVVTGSLSADEIEALIEAIIEEKWEDISIEIEGFERREEKLNKRISEIEMNIKEIVEQIKVIKEEISEKQVQTNKNIDNVNVEMEAFGKAMQQIVPSLSSTVRELKSALNEIRSERK